MIEESGQILSISKSHRGRIHDFRIRKQEKLLPKDSIKYADSGYQGWQKLQKNVVIPYKKYRKKPLTEGQKEHNRKLASFRMRVENKIREIKIFKIMSNIYRSSFTSCNTILHRKAFICVSACFNFLYKCFFLTSMLLKRFEDFLHNSSNGG